MVVEVAGSPGPDRGPTEILYGRHAVLEALRAARRRVDAIYLSRQSRRSLQPFEERAAALGIPRHWVSADELERLSGSRQHQGIGLRVGRYPLQALTTVVSAASLPARRQVLVVLDNIVDPHNLGAIIRTALAVEAAGVIIPRDRAAGPTPAVSKASAGALEHATLIQVTNLAATLKSLKEGGWWIFGLDRRGDRSIFETDLAGPTAVVVGSEGRGIRPLVKKQCDRLLFIPQSGPVAALNASVAAAVCLYEVYRQRTGSIRTRGGKK
jgi:23S rRNA (guanosine2251-2'-O)-methyltransferase